MGDKDMNHINYYALSPTTGMNRNSCPMSFSAHSPSSSKCNKQKFESGVHARNLLRSLNENRKHSSLNDGEVIIEGRRFPVQRCILAAASPYFRALYDFDIPSQLDQTTGRFMVSMECVKAEAFAEILNYIYTGHVTLTEHNIEDILQAGDHFLMNDLKEVCCDYLEQCIDANNCLGIMEFAERYSCPRVYRAAKEFLHSNFSVVCQTEEFVLLSASRLCEILKQDRLIVKDEEEVLRSLIRWVKYDESSRQEHLKSLLLGCVRLDTLYSRELAESRGLLGDVIEKMIYTVQQESLKMVGCRPSFLPRGQTNVLLIVGGVAMHRESREETALNTVSCTELPPGNWLPPGKYLELAPMLTARTNHSVIEAGDYLFAIGGQDYNHQILNSGEKYDPETNTWEPIASMKYPRELCSLVTVKNKIYALGSARDEELTTGEVYNVDTNQWRPLPQMRIRRRNVTAAVSQGKIYVIGGINNGKLFDTVEVFDPDLEVWYAGPPLAERRSWSHAATCGDDIFVFGGFRPLECPTAGSNRFKFCQTEAYYPESNPEKWIHVPSGSGMMTFPESSHIDGALSRNECVYIVGDLDLGGAFHYVRAFNTTTNQWQDVIRDPPFNKRGGRPIIMQVSRACIWKRISDACQTITR